MSPDQSKGVGRNRAGHGPARMRLLDLFSCAGGAAWGYHLAGFEVVGVDLRPQPRYPFEFIQADVLSLDPEFVAGFDAVHASPPCQFATALRHAPGGKEHVNLIPQTRDLIKLSGLPYVIENVEGAREHLRDPTTLCGSAFGLGAQGCELQRHRLFETSFPLPVMPCRHDPAKPVIGVYGGHARRRSAKHGGRGTRDVWEGGHRAAMSEAMGMEWATCAEMSEAIPPAYTRWIGERLLSALSTERAAA